MKILIGINVLETISCRPYLSHLAFASTIHKDFPGIKVFWYTPYRMQIDRMRNEAAKLALEYECDYLMFIDDDVIIDQHTLKSLVEADKDIVMAETYVRGNPFNAMFFKYDEEGSLVHYNDYDKDVDEKGLLSADAVGFSCVLIKCSLLLKLTTPYFITGENFTEDVFFCLKAVDELKDTTIAVDTKVPTGHQMMPGIVTRANAKLLRQFAIDEDKALLGFTGDMPSASPDRGDCYEELVLKAFDSMDKEVNEIANSQLPKKPLQLLDGIEAQEVDHFPNIYQTE